MQEKLEKYFFSLFVTNIKKLANLRLSLNYVAWQSKVHIFAVTIQARLHAFSALQCCIEISLTFFPEKKYKLLS